MSEKKRAKSGKTVLSILCILAAAIMAILVHALLPGGDAGETADSFDSVFVKALGFPVVASAYFVFLYLQILFVIKKFGKRSNLSRGQVGVRFGVAYGLIYIVGMQEVVLSASPFSEYGKDFILYQLSMGLGDAIPAFAFCVAISALFLSSEKSGKIISSKRNFRENVIIPTAIAAGFFLQRMAGYLTGYIASDFDSYPIQTVVWTILFGLTLGFAYVLLAPVYSMYGKNKKGLNILVVSLGINWIWFNLFIGLIFDGLFFEMFIRGAADILTVFVFYVIACI